MKNPTFKQLGGLSGSVADCLIDIRDRLDGEKLQMALSNPNHPFHQGIVTLALDLFPVAPKVTEKDNIIYITLTSNGMGGPEWEAHFDRRKIELSTNARKILNSPQFKATKAGTAKPTAIIKGELFPDSDRLTKNIRAKASELKLKKPDIELGCLIRDAFPNKQINDLGLNWIVDMHEPVEIDGYPNLLTAYAGGAVPGLDAFYGGPGGSWGRGGGFAFDASQVLKT